MATGTKTGGRKVGTPNKVTTDLREKFTLLLEDNIDKLQKDIDSLEPKDRIRALIEVSKFVIPTLKATELTTDNDNNNFQPVIIKITGMEIK